MESVKGEKSGVCIRPAQTFEAGTHETAEECAFIFAVLNGKPGNFTENITGDALDVLQEREDFWGRFHLS